MTTKGEGSSASVECPVMRVGSIMRMLGHDRIDVLKMDIEGAEYDVLADILSANLHIGQILVEFHHRFTSGGLKRTRDVTAVLRGRGYRLVWVSLKGIEYSFQRDPSG